MKACKHGHVDGAMHRPCLRCRIEHLEAKMQMYEDTLRQIAEGNNKTARKRLARAALSFGTYTLASD